MLTPAGEGPSLHGTLPCVALRPSVSFCPCTSPHPCVTASLQVTPPDVSPCPSVTLPLSHALPKYPPPFLRVTPTRHRSLVLWAIWGRGTGAGGCRGERGYSALEPLRPGNAGPVPQAELGSTSVPARWHGDLGGTWDTGAAAGTERSGLCRLRGSQGHRCPGCPWGEVASLPAGTPPDTHTWGTVLPGPTLQPGVG